MNLQRFRILAVVVLLCSAVGVLPSFAGSRFKAFGNFIQEQVNKTTGEDAAQQEAESAEEPGKEEALKALGAFFNMQADENAAAGGEQATQPLDEESMKALGESIKQAEKNAAGGGITSQGSGQAAVQNGMLPWGNQVTPGEDQTVANRNVKYAGYSKKFLIVKDLLADGNAVEAYQLQMTKLEKSKKKPNFLFDLEQATIAMDANKLVEARKYLDHAERLLDQRHKTSVTKGFFKSLGSSVIQTAGFSELGAYKGEAYERILMLNYKSIAYMLEGDRKAYNVTRRAIDWQNMEKKAFDKKMEEEKEKIKKKEEAQAEKGNDVASFGIFDMILDQYKASEEKALQLPSAFVNPFGFYMAGIVQEFDSYEDSSLRDNARISYKKAQELNPESEVIKQSIKEIQEPAPRDKRLVQIVVADGFAPEKKVMRFDYVINGNTVPIKLTIYEPDESLVARVEVHDAEGNKLTTLSNIADIDAISLRYQYDSLPKQHLKVTMAIIRSVFENKLYEKAGGFGSIIKMVREEKTNPDMRSWMSLPKKVLAARLYLPKDVGGLRLVSYDKEGVVLADKELTVGTSRHNFVYARTLGSTMYINQNERMWVALR